MLKVSVALAVYNGEKYLNAQLKSIESQSVLPFEIVIVDDNSTDNTSKIIKDFEKNSKLNIKFYKNEENVGFLKNFKKALSHISGDICLLCDQDDIWEQDKIKEMTEVFADNSVSGCAAGFRFIGEQDEFTEIGRLKEGVYAFIKDKPSDVLSKISFKNIARMNIAPGCACGYRKGVVDLFLENASPDLPHDYQLAAISSVLGGFYYLNKPLTRYRIHGENTLGLKPLCQTRLDVAKEKLSLSETVKNVCETGENYNKMSRKRYEFLSNKKPSGIFSLCFLSEYRKYYTVKERLGDLIYACK